MTEQQPYEVVAELPGFELRRYPAHHVAETVVSGNFEGAGNAAFRSLFRYITGRNDSSASIAMTAPVVQQAAEDPDQFVVAFVMPQRYADDSPPTPADPTVRVRQVPGGLAPAARFSGRWSRRSYDQHTDRLLRDVAAAGLAVAGPVRFARFDPPWTPWFLRHNEVVVPVAK